MTQFSFFVHYTLKLNAFKLCKRLLCGILIFQTIYTLEIWQHNLGIMLPKGTELSLIPSSAPPT